ncbi:60S ribosomal protein L13 [Pleurotus pulmonarius]|nr:60S ribosomal protein L13 [Pleurotus pulmonarius]KAF4606641.1 60S ribosomal protein L13 [Pleurotus pulmonarius]
MFSRAFGDSRLGTMQLQATHPDLADSAKRFRHHPQRPQDIKTKPWVLRTTTDWQRRVRTWFDQPGRKLRRRNARKAKATTLGVRPLTLLRPAVRGQTVRYNRKLREGRGFTLAELKEAGVGKKEARGVGIVVDHRRRNLSQEGKSVNVERLKAYKARLIVFPRKAGKPKKGDSSPEDLTAETTRAPLPLPTAYPAESPRKITEEEREFDAYKTLRHARANKRYEGARKLRAAKKEEEEAAKKK